MITLLPLVQMDSGSGWKAEGWMLLGIPAHWVEIGPPALGEQNKPDEECFPQASPTARALSSVLSLHAGKTNTRIRVGQL